MPTVADQFKLDMSQDNFTEKQNKKKKESVRLLFGEESHFMSSDNEENELHSNFINHPDAPDVLELTRLNIPNSHIHEDQQVPFPLYENKDIKFLNKNTAMGKLIGESIHTAEFDDDCNTDEDMQMNA